MEPITPMWPEINWKALSKTLLVGSWMALFGVIIWIPFTVVKGCNRDFDDAAQVGLEIFVWGLEGLSAAVEPFTTSARLLREKNALLEDQYQREILARERRKEQCGCKGNACLRCNQFQFPARR